MRLEKFRIKNYRSIKDSEEIHVTKITAFLGRNDSGKSNILKALYSLNPASGFEGLKKATDIPRHRDEDQEGIDEDPIVVDTTWILDKADKEELSQTSPRGSDAESIRIMRRYNGNERYVSFEGIASIEKQDAKVREAVYERIEEICTAIGREIPKLDNKQRKNSLATTIDSLKSNIAAKKAEALAPWYKEVTDGVKKVQQKIVSYDLQISEGVKVHIKEILGNKNVQDLLKELDRAQAGEAWVLRRLPKFMYLDQYPEILGRQNIKDFLHREENNSPVPQDRYFKKLCKVARLDLDKLQSAEGDSEMRNYLTSIASERVTRRIQALWADKKLKVRFHVDTDNLDISISDVAGPHPSEINLNERGRGFRWFFSFYVTFAADTEGGDAQDAILLFDEPGLYLHGNSQAALLSHLEDGLKNQIMFSTHSPFMIPLNNLDYIKTVDINDKGETIVDDSPTGDALNIRPLQAAIGCDLAQSFFMEVNILLVEGKTDAIMLSAISEYLTRNGQGGLMQSLTILPVGGAGEVDKMAKLLAVSKFNVTVLLDEDRAARSAKDKIAASKLLKEDRIIFITEAYEGRGRPQEAEIEDLFEPDFYQDLVQRAYAGKLKGKTITRNTNIPRITEQVRQGLKNLGIAFKKDTVARFLKTSLSESEQSTPPGMDESMARFERLFQKLNASFQPKPRSSK